MKIELSGYINKVRDLLTNSYVFYYDAEYLNTKNRTYLTSKVNSLFLVKFQFQRDSERSNKKLPTKNGEESCVVDYMIEISNLDLLKDLAEVVEYVCD
jgi:hypothetical protein